MLGTNVHILTMSRNTVETSHELRAAGSPAGTPAWLGKPASLSFATGRRRRPSVENFGSMQLVQRGTPVEGNGTLTNAL